MFVHKPTEKAGKDMVGCLPTRRTFCTTKKLTPKPHSAETRARREFLNSHTFSVHIGKDGKARLDVKEIE